jgi:O-antigen ligase
MEIESGRQFSVAAVAMFALGFLPMPFGSVSTVVYFALGLATLVEIARRRVSFRLPPAVQFAAVVCVAYFLLNAVSVVIYENQAGSVGPLVGALHFLVWPVVFAGLASDKFDAVRCYVYGARAGALLGGAIAIIQVSDGIDRATGGMINSVPFGTTAVWFACVSLIGSWDSGWRNRAFAGAAFAAGLAAAFLSETRGAWLPLPFLLIVMLFYLRYRYGGRAAVWALGMISALSVGAAIVAGDSIRERLGETVLMFRDFELGGDAPSLDQRALMTVYGLEAVADRPLTGYGPQNAMPEVIGRAARDGFEILRYRHLHSEYLWAAVANGIAGVAVLLVLLATPVATALRLARDDVFKDRMAIAGIATIGAALTGITHGVFHHDITNTVYLGMLLAVGLGARARDRRKSASASGEVETPGR